MSEGGGTVMAVASGRLPDMFVLIRPFTLSRNMIFFLNANNVVFMPKPTRCPCFAKTYIYSGEWVANTQGFILCRHFETVSFAGLQSVCS